MLGVEHVRLGDQLPVKRSLRLASLVASDQQDRRPFFFLESLKPLIEDVGLCNLPNESL